MKTYKLYIAIAFLLTGITACEKEMKVDTTLNVDVASGQDVSFDGKTVTVKKGTPVTFNFDGDPDYLTFFSGELFKEYKHKDRTAMQLEDLDICELSFGVTAVSGKLENADITVHVSDKFPGLAKNNFEADRLLLDQEFKEWEVLLEKGSGEYPEKVWGNETDATKPENVKWVTKDLKSYLGKNITFAISYKGMFNTAAQPKFLFLKMQMKKVFNNGLGSTLTANGFGFTPVNMLCKEGLTDQAAASYKPVSTDKEYGYVTNNIAGLWKLADWTNFSIHSSGTNAVLKYSWLVSNPIAIDAACQPDKGMAIKNITQSLPAYTHTYAQTGTYTATFVANNANYVHQGGEVVRELTINVIE